MWVCLELSSTASDNVQSSRAAQFCSPGAFYLYIKELMVISGDERSRLLSYSVKMLM